MPRPLFVTMTLFLVLGLILHAFSSDKRFIQTFLTALLFIFLILPLSFPLYRKFCWYEPINFVILMYFFCYVVKPLYILYLGNFHIAYISLPIQNVTSSLSVMLWLAILGILSFYGGYFFKLGHHIAKIIPTPVSLSRKPSDIGIVIASLSVIGLATYVIWMQSAGGILYYTTHLASVTAGEIRASAGILFWGRYAFVAATILWLISMLERKRCALIWWIHFGVASFMLFSIGNRFQLLGFWISLLIIYDLFKRRISLKHLVTALTMFLVLIMVFNIYRGISSVRGFSLLLFLNRVTVELSPRNILTTLVLGGNFDATDMFVAILHGVPARFPPLYGRPFAEALWQLLPQSLIPGVEQAPPLGVTLTKALVPWRPVLSGGINPSLLGFFYVNLLWAGIIIGMFFFGVFARLIYAYLTINRENKYVFPIYSIVTTYFIFWFTRTGELFTVMRVNFALLIFLLSGILFLSRGRLSVRRHRSANDIPQEKSYTSERNSGIER